MSVSVVAQELNEEAEPVNIEIEARGIVTNQTIIEHGLTENAETPRLETIQTENIEPIEATTAATNYVPNPKAAFLLDTGIQYSEEGEYEDAERAYLRALKADPENESILFRLSTLYLLMNRAPEAVSILEALTEVSPENARVHNNLAWAYATGDGVRNKKKALLHARESILSAPNEPNMWNTLAEAYFLAGDYERAERIAKHAIELMGQTNLEKANSEGFQKQLHKIQRAAKALKMFQGLDDE